MRLLITALLSLSFSVTPASAAVAGSLESAFNELNYSLHVEWDQQDMAFHDEQVRLFQARLTELKAQGMTNEELVTFALSSIKDQRQADALVELIDVVNTAQLSSAQIDELLSTFLESHYGQGSSWSGRATYLGVGVVVVVAVVLAINGFDGTHRLTRGSKS